MRYTLCVRSVIISLGFALLVGCAQSNVPMSENFWQNKQQKIAVTTTQAPVPQLYEMGNQGLLDIAISATMNSDLNQYLKRADLTWYYRFPQDFAQQISQRHLYAKSYSEQLSASRTDYAGFAVQANSDTVLIIKLQALGAKRNYYAFIPTEAPQAY